MYERFAAVVVICLAFLLFWSPILVTISAIILSAFYYKSNYWRHKSNGETAQKKIRPKSSQQMTSDNRFGSNVRPIKAARRTLSFRNTSADNYSLSYLTEPLNAKYFQQSDSLLSSTSGLSLGSRPPSAVDISYSSAYRPPSVSPISQFGSMPFVKLSSTNSESLPHELKLKVSPVKPVTVRIAPMPQNFSKLTLNRLSNHSASVAPTMGANTGISSEASTSLQTKAVVDALKKSLRRKREPKSDFEVEDNYTMSANKKPKRESTESQMTPIPNGTVPSKQPVKRQAIDGSDAIFKRFKNNEIFSSYSSSPQFSQGFNNKRKLSPESKQTNEVKIMKSLPSEPDPEQVPKVVPLNSNHFESMKFNFISDNIQETRPQFTEEVAPKRSYGLPLHLHSMEDHERDRNKTKHRLNRFLTAVKEATSPKSEEGSARLTTTLEPVIVTEIDQAVTSSATKAPEIRETQVSSEVGLPEVPAAAIFTNSRVDTIVTTSLLNTPISSVLTTNKDSLRPSLSPQMMNADNSVTSSAATSDSGLNPTPNAVITESSSISSLSGWPPNPLMNSNVALFTAKPQPQSQSQQNMLFSVGSGGSTTRRIAQSTRLRSRQRRWPNNTENDWSIVSYLMSCDFL